MVDGCVNFNNEDNKQLLEALGSDKKAFYKNI